jgi:transcriptional regulator with XRE-family HTH domain
MEQLTAYRTAHRLTQQALAEKLRTSAGYLHDIETGRRRPSPGLAVRIEHVTGIPRHVLRPDVYASVIPSERVA